MALNPKTVFRTPWFEIATVDPGAEPNGTTEPYFVMLRRDGVIGMILDEAGRVVLVQQFRPPLGRATLEMPAGTIEPGEAPEQAMAREILEETGFICEALIKVAPCRLMLNRENAVEHFFLGLRARPAPGFVRRERGTVRPMGRREMRDLVAAGAFEQTVALGALYVVQKSFGVDLLEDPLESIERRFLREECAAGATW
jgi:ADP-ribose pyrophosphatase